VVRSWDARVLDLLAGWVQAKTSSYFPPGEAVPPGYEFLAVTSARCPVQPLVAAGPVTDCSSPPTPSRRARSDGDRRRWSCWPCTAGPCSSWRARWRSSPAGHPRPADGPAQPPRPARARAALRGRGRVGARAARPRRLQGRQRPCAATRR
jgi:hypothetical protein